MPDLNSAALIFFFGVGFGMCVAALIISWAIKSKNIEIIRKAGIDADNVSTN